MPHYYSEEQDVALNPFKVRIKARGKETEVWSGSGVFSVKGLDNATKLLLNECVLEEGWDVHDLGCGSGIVGVIVKLAEPSCNVLCSDIAKNALLLAKMNARGRGFKVRKSDGYAKIEEKFDTILLNPPYVAGRKVVFRLLEEAKDHLKPKGLLQVVARHQKGGKMIMKKMEELFGNCDDSRKKSGFRVYISQN